MKQNLKWILGVAATALMATAHAEFVDTSVSRATPEGQGQIVDGKQVRYRGAPFAGVQGQWGEWRTYRDDKPFPPPQKVTMPTDLQGDAERGRKLYMARSKAPCTGCHLIRGDDVWPAGNVSTDHQQIGDRYNTPELEAVLYQFIYDSRVFNPESFMPPWGTIGVMSPQEIVDIIAFLRTQKGPLPEEKDPARNPNTRPLPEYYFGDNLDPTNNAAVIQAEGALEIWSKQGPKGKSCADCHGPVGDMKGVATAYPKYFPLYRRVMSMEDMVAWHGADETGLELPSQGMDNITLALLIRMQSNGMPVNVDVTSPEAKAAFERGKERYYQRVGLRNHACADCHDAERGGGKFLGGRLLGKKDDGMTKHFPTFRTNFAQIWDMRRRFQWCTTPLGMDYLPADAVEYAEIELYLTSFDNGKEISAPGMRH
jgi:L-cysteine S-thiosulfotransferase